MVSTNSPDGGRPATLSEFDRNRAPYAYPTEQSLAHGYPFDPSYGYDLQGLFAIEPPPVPDGFAEVWRERYRAALAVDPSPRLARSRDRHAGYHCLDIAYRSTDDFPDWWLAVDP
jgi:hypothetical protein